MQLFHLYPMAFERGQHKLGVGVLLRFKGRAEVVRKSGQTEREVLRKPRTKRIERGNGWSTWWTCRKDPTGDPSAAVSGKSPQPELVSLPPQRL